MTYNQALTRYGYFRYAYFDPNVLVPPLPPVGLTRMGVLFQPKCVDGARYPVLLLVFDPALRDYIYLSQTYPSRLPPLPPSPATWSVTNLRDPSVTSPINFALTLPGEA